VGGGTASLDFPTTSGAFQPTLAGGPDGFPDGFVTKLNRSGSRLVYSTYLGGVNDDQISGIALDRQGAVHTTGFTRSLDFPTSPNAFQPTLADHGDADPEFRSDAFVAKLNRRGTALVYATYLGGNRQDAAIGIRRHRRGVQHSCRRERSSRVCVDGRRGDGRSRNAR
jgi:hypothetical protein